MITSSQNAKIKLARALQGRPKEREAAGAFVAEGVRLVEEALDTGWPAQFLLFSTDLSERGQELIKQAKAAGLEADEVSPQVLQSASETETAQGILAVLALGELPLPSSPDFILILDQIRDPGNLGTLLRTADAAGVQAVLLPPESADAFAPKVVRAGMGAHFRLPIRTMTWERIGLMCESANLQVLLAEMDGRPYWETDLRRPLALIVGGEAEGASEQARKLAAGRIGIPMQARPDSLNAAVAGSVLMFEVARQRS